MSTTAPNSKLSDPRIVSPQIKVIYPSQNTEKNLETPETTTSPIPQVLPTVTPPVPVTTKETPIVSTVVTEPATTVTNPVTPVKSSTWIDTLKDHSHLFIAVALISIGIGIIIGKKM